MLNWIKKKYNIWTLTRALNFLLVLDDRMKAVGIPRPDRRRLWREMGKTQDVREKVIRKVAGSIGVNLDKGK